VVLATNGTLVGYETLPPTLMKYLDTVTVSIHNREGFQGLKWLLKQKHIFESEVNPWPKVDASVVIGESTGVLVDEIQRALRRKPRMYKRHTIDGKWGAIKWGNIDNPHKGKLERKFCERLNTDLQICWDGQVSRCCHVWVPEPNLNVNHDTIDYIWNCSPELKAIRDNYPDEICAGCDQWIGGGKTL
jgi:hypothetical protein